MPKSTSPNSILIDCEPFFLDGAQVVAEFARRNQTLVRKAVELRLDPLAEALGFAKDDLVLLDYWEPNRFQKVNPTDGISMGVKLKVSDYFEAAVYRYWEVEEKETGIAVYTWIKGRAELDQFSKEIEDADAFPEPEDSWYSVRNSIGTYFICRILGTTEFAELDLRIEEVVSYYIRLLAKVRGVKRFLK